MFIYNTANLESVKDYKPINGQTTESKNNEKK